MTTAAAPIDAYWGTMTAGRSEDEGMDMLEFSRILTAAGLAIAPVGLVVYGMGVAFVEPRDFETNLGLILMIGGVIATIIGVFLYRQAVED
jgi:hypothetical protein